VPVRIVLQRVTTARVEIDGLTVGEIGPGLLALVGVAHGDTAGDAVRLADKTAALRIFAGPSAPFDRTVAEAGGGVLCVSQFTLYGSVRRGNRPSWSAAAPGEEARRIVDAYAEALAARGIPVATGRFGADMAVSLTNDGPVTIVLDTDVLAEPRRTPGTAAPGA
jgi:D-aminoacyl-tRNA deacylase